MPPKKKKNAPRNAYYFYMLDFREKKEAEGHKFPGGLKDVADAASFSWKGLDPKSKRYYENLAEREKVGGSRGVRYNTQGQTYDEAEREKLEKERQEKKMLEEINVSVIGGGREGLKHKRFYFIHVNHFGAMENNHYIPCEIAVLGYTVEKGFEQENLFHEFIKNFELPNGYSFKAKAHSESIHHCRLPPHSMGTCNVGEIREKIWNLIDRNGDIVDGMPPPLYTLGMFLPECVDFFNFIYEGDERVLHDVGNAGSSVFRVYPLEQLFLDMKNFSVPPVGQRFYVNGLLDEGFPYVARADDILKQDTYAFAKGICCDFHEEEDVRQHCSRSYVIRWSYVLSDYLCANLGVELKVVSHQPKGVTLQASVVSEMHMNRLKITSHMDQLKLEPDLPRDGPVGRGTPLNTGAIPKPRSPPWKMVAAPGTRNPSKSVECASRGRLVHDQPLTIIDHSEDRPREGAVGRGTPLYASALPSSRGLPVSGARSIYGGTDGESKNRNVYKKPLTLIDHSQFADPVDSSDEDDFSVVPSKRYVEDAPLRQPRTQAKSSLMLDSALSPEASSTSPKYASQVAGLLGRGRGDLLKNLPL